MRFLARIFEGEWCVWDRETDEPAILGGIQRLINLSRAKAEETADDMNEPGE